MFTVIDVDAFAVVTVAAVGGRAVPFDLSSGCTCGCGSGYGAPLEGLG